MFDTQYFVIEIPMIWSKTCDIFFFDNHADCSNYSLKEHYHNAKRHLIPIYSPGTYCPLLHLGLTCDGLNADNYFRHCIETYNDYNT